MLRNREWVKIEAAELVPGDIIRIRSGDIIPADITILQDEYLMIDQSMLTGESLPVERGNLEKAYSGSILKRGESSALVIATGMDSYFGKTAKLVEKAKPESEFQKTIIRIGNHLMVLAIILIMFITAVAISRNESLGTILQFALILAVASIPAALPVFMSVTLTIGATLLAKKGVIVRRLVSIEELASVWISCAHTRPGQSPRTS